MNDNSWTAKWMLQPVRHCCKGSQLCLGLSDSQQFGAKGREMEELGIKSFDEIATLPKGTKIKISQIGYYNYWYPSHDQDFDIFLEEDISAVKVDWRGGGDKWEPYRVTAETARKYGSPIKVIWITKQRGNDNV